MKLSEQEFDVWISLTNEDGAWAEVPFQLPPIVLHGTTTSGWGIGFGRHIPRKEDCKACRLPRPHQEFRGPCAEGEVISVAESTDQEEADVVPVTASLPFLSAASAALLANELMKLNFPEVVSLPNSVSVSGSSGLSLKQPICDRSMLSLRIKTRGPFVSTSGFTDDGLEAFGSGKRVVCMDGLDDHEDQADQERRL